MQGYVQTLTVKSISFSTGWRLWLWISVYRTFIQQFSATRYKLFHGHFTWLYLSEATGLLGRTKRLQTWASFNINIYPPKYRTPNLYFQVVSKEGTFSLIFPWKQLTGVPICTEKKIKIKIKGKNWSCRFDVQEAESRMTTLFCSFIVLFW